MRAVGMVANALGMSEHRIITTIEGKVYELHGYTTGQLRTLLLIRYADGVTRHLRDIGVIDPKLIVDVGAHIGARTAVLAMRWPDCKILAIEPVAQNLELLEFNTQYFPNVEILPFAASSVSGFTTMEMPTQEQFYQKKDVDLRKDYGLMSIHGKSGRHRQQVELKRLDDIIGNDPVDFIKIDTEGHEYHVLKGAHNTLANQRPAVEVEIAKPQQTMAGHTVMEILLLMAQYRYARIFSTKVDHWFMPA